MTTFATAPRTFCTDCDYCGEIALCYSDDNGGTCCSRCDRAHQKNTDIIKAAGAEVAPALPAYQPGDEIVVDGQIKTVKRTGTFRPDLPGAWSGYSKLVMLDLGAGHIYYPELDEGGPAPRVADLSLAEMEELGLDAVGPDFDFSY